MNKKTINVTSYIIVSLVVIGIVFYCLNVVASRAWRYPTELIQEFKNLILHETNHQELISESQDFLENHTEYYEFSDPNWPAVIKKLKPSCVYTSQNHLYIERGGSYISYGVVIGKEKPDMPHFKQRKISEGLWYYQEK